MEAGRAPIAASLRVVSISLLLQSACWAQTFPSAPERVQSGNQFENSPFNPPDKIQPFELPIAPIAPETHRKITPSLYILVRAYRFSGNTAISTPELQKIAEPYTGKKIASEDLLALKDKLTRLYISRGYINSGATLPDQEVGGGEVSFQIIEGHLSEVDISGLKRLRVEYVKNRVKLSSTEPLNVNDLQQNLLLLQQDPLIGRLNAELRPGVVAGESTLKIAVEEANPFQMGLGVNNHFSPSVGAIHGDIFALHRNLFGNGETLEAKLGATQGINDYSFSYAMPLNASGASIMIRKSQSSSVVVEAPFNRLDIASKTKTTAVNVEVPLWKNMTNSFLLGFSLEQRASQTSLLGIPFSFSAGVNNGVSTENVLRFSQDWVRRSREQVVSLRSKFSCGSNDALPKIKGNEPDKHFFTWLGQAQLAKRLSAKGESILLRGDMQYAGNNLLTMEKLGIGGAKTVRGYREVQLLRDNGFIISAEYRLPVFLNNAGESHVQMAAFIDYGKGWNREKAVAPPSDIASIGLGVLWDPTKNLHAELYWGKALRHFTVSGRRDLQDSGIHFSLDYQFGS